MKNLRFLHGIGKCKSFKDDRRGPRIAKGKPILCGTSQGCSRIKKISELPK